MDVELLYLSAGIILLGLVGLIFRSRFLIKLAGGSLAISILWKIGQMRGWLLDSKAVVIMYITASVFGYLLALAISPPSISLRRRKN